MQPGQLERALLDGLFESIPGRPMLLSERSQKRADQVSGNRYVGIGIMLAFHDGEKLPQITVPFRRGTARRAGVKPGDLVLEVDGKNTQGVSDLEQVVTWVQGPEGSSLTLVVRQPGAAAKRTLQMTRALIPLDSVFGFRRISEEEWDYRVEKEAGIAYAWVKSLTSSTLHELRQLERRLQAEGVRGLVLDFRWSAGEGQLHNAALVADGLLDGGLMWTVAGKEDKEYRADRECLFRGWPLVVLVNDITDNAQGAVLAALQDNKRAVLTGEPTKADGTVRRLYPIPGQAEAITVLTGQLERADRSRAWQVRPDRTVELTWEQRSMVQKWLTDKLLPELPPGTDDRPPDDPQLACGLALLRETLKRTSSPEKPGGSR